MNIVDLAIENIIKEYGNSSRQFITKKTSF